MARPFVIGNSIWISTVAFSQLFEDIEVRNYSSRYDSSSLQRRLTVDVSLDTKERIYHKLTAGGHAKLEQADTRLPRISIQISGITPDTTRYAGKNVKRNLVKNFTGVNGENNISYDLQPFPIKIEYSVGIWTKYFEHYAQILENIIPWFDPYLTVGVKERNFGIERELKVSLTSVGQNSVFEMEGAQTRIVRGELLFTVDTFAYKTLSEEFSTLIEVAETHVIDIVTPISSETISVSADASDVLL